MTTLREAAQQALEALDKLVVGSEYEKAVEAERAMDALRSALAEPPTNQCAETCERAKLCAVCARELSHE